MPRYRQYFNPRTHKGCDRFSCASFSDSAYFNPRTHKGCDSGILTTPFYDLISIHAPTKGATASNFHDILCNNDFNPRTHKGCDYCYSRCLLVPFDFNPRTHKGCDCKTVKNISDIYYYFAFTLLVFKLLSQISYNLRLNSAYSRCESPRESMFACLSHLAFTISLIRLVLQQPLRLSSQR